jgi:vacuolar-type H+-ATPase subunit F/Vma7
VGVPVFIGDEVTASGFRLGGARIVVAGDGNAESLVRDAATGSDPILISSRCAALLPPELLDDMLSSLRPLVVIVPDAAGREPPDVRKHVRRTLDLE